MTLKTNSTYFVFCARVSIEPHMDGGRNFLRAGREFGTWKWDREHSEVVFMATNRNHMMEVFPARMKVDTRDLNRLKVIQTAPTTGLPVGLASIPLSPPYFYRKIQ